MSKSRQNGNRATQVLRRRSQSVSLKLLDSRALFIDDCLPLEFGLMLQRKLHQRVAAMNANFCADVISMILNRADTHTELVSNLTTRKVFRN